MLLFFFLVSFQKTRVEKEKGQLKRWHIAIHSFNDLKIKQIDLYVMLVGFICIDHLTLLVKCFANVKLFQISKSKLSLVWTKYLFRFLWFNNYDLSIRYINIYYKVYSKNNLRKNYKNIVIYKELIFLLQTVPN